MGGPNDAALQEPSNPVSDVLNSGVSWLMGLGGYSTDRRGVQGDGNDKGTAPGDNSFYRDNASWMPGWGNTFGLPGLDPHGLPSGATAQDRATNYVGQTDPTGVWGDVRANLVTNESAAITAAKGRGDDHIGFGDVYGAHVDAYSDAQAAAKARDPSSTAGNTFIDPASFALAVYGAPLMEHLGINAGPITGASIDMFNDPTDSVGDGWAKRMGLSAGEIGAGGLAAGKGALDMMTGSPIQGGLEMLGGVGLMGLGAFSGAWNTATAIGNGMGVGDAVSGIGHVAGSVGSAAWSGAKDIAGGVADGASSLWHSIVD